MENTKTAVRDGHVWVVVVATDEPGASPLQQSLSHARELAPRERIHAVVTEEDREGWRRPLWILPASNVIAQPETAPVEEGVSRSMRRIFERDREANIVFLPAARAALASVAPMTC
jgi:hypothetical protein